MEDLSDIIKKGLQDLYKNKNGKFSTVNDRLQKMNEHRKIVRHDVAFEKRKIPANMTPILSPVVKREKFLKKMDNPVPSKRLEMLAKWKADKEKKKQEEKKKVKPLFKVTHVPLNVGLPDLKMVNKEIKGKPFKSKFAPPNHKFKPPANIKPISLNCEEKGEGRRIVTRSQTRAATATSGSSKAKEMNKKAVPKSKKQPKPKDKPKETDAETNTNDLNESMSPDFPIVPSNRPEDVKTPEKGEPPVYISPFVTVSRGKNSARKEYEARRSGKSFSIKPDTDNCTSPKAGAAYFAWRLDNQTARLEELCDKWTKYKMEDNLPEEAVSMIDVAIGQTNLLITKKFVQFKSLVDRCKNGDSETPVTCEDLHGFWDMMYIQVVNLEKRFENLQNLKANNWEEIVPEVSKKLVKKRGRPVKTVTATSRLKEAIQAARKKKQEEKNPTESERKTPQNRRSSRAVSMKSTEVTHRNSSPGLMMMKVAQYAKGVETPAKSILKNDAPKSAKSHSKTVLFQDRVDDIENDLNKLNLQTKVQTPSRRSSRLNKSKLF